MIFDTQNTTPDLGDVLLAFMCSCPTPNMAEVTAWQARYPEFADDILETAARTAEHVMSGVDLEELPNEPGDDALATAFVERARLLDRHSRQGETLGEMIRVSGASAAEIEARMGFEGEFLEAAADGELALPVPVAILQAFSSAVGRPVAAAMAAFERSARMPNVIHMSAASAQPPRQTTYAEIVASMDASEDRKAFWLSRK